MLITDLEISDPDRRIDYVIDLDYDPHTTEFVVQDLRSAFAWHGDYGWPLVRVVDDRRQQTRMLEWLGERLRAEILDAIEQRASVLCDEWHERRRQERVERIAGELNREMSKGRA